MNDWLKRGAVALVLGAFCTLSGVASSEPKPGILTPPIKADAKGGGADAKKNTGGEPIAKLDKGAPEAAGSAAASAAPAGSAGAAPPGLDEEKIKEIRAKAKARIEEVKAKAKEHRAEIKKKVEEKLKGQPMTTALKEELKRHARRISRLNRAKDVAQEANDTETVGRIDKLIAKENGRHDGWMGKFEVKAAAGSNDKAGAK